MLLFRECSRGLFNNRNCASLRVRFALWFLPLILYLLDIHRGKNRMEFGRKSTAVEVFPTPPFWKCSIISLLTLYSDHGSIPENQRTAEKSLNSLWNPRRGRKICSVQILKNLALCKCPVCIFTFYKEFSDTIKMGSAN